MEWWLFWNFVRKDQTSFMLIYLKNRNKWSQIMDWTTVSDCIGKHGGIWFALCILHAYFKATLLQSATSAAGTSPSCFHHRRGTSRRRDFCFCPGSDGTYRYVPEPLVVVFWHCVGGFGLIKYILLYSQGTGHARRCFKHTICEKLSTVFDLRHLLSSLCFRVQGAMLLFFFAWVVCAQMGCHGKNGKTVTRTFWVKIILWKCSFWTILGLSKSSSVLPYFFLDACYCSLPPHPLPGERFGATGRAGGACWALSFVNVMVIGS